MSTATVFAITPPTSDHVRALDGGTATRNGEGWLVRPYLLVDPHGELELPGGLIDGDAVHKRVDVRPLAGWEEDILASGQDPDLLNQVLANCVTLIGDQRFDPNPDKRTREEAALALSKVKKLLAGDAMYLLFALRRRSFPDGDTYKFKGTCPNQRCSNRHTLASVNLAEFAIHPMPDPRRRIVELTTPIGKKVVRWKQLAQADVERVSALQRQHELNQVSAQLFGHIVDVDGKPLVSPVDLKPWPSADRDAVRASVNAEEAGINIREAISITCKGCGTTYNYNIEPGPSFFLPSAAM